MSKVFEYKSCAEFLLKIILQKELGNIGFKDESHIICVKFQKKSKEMLYTPCSIFEMLKVHKNQRGTYRLRQL